MHIMQVGSGGNGLPPGVDALAPAVAEPSGVGTVALGPALAGAVADADAVIALVVDAFAAALGIDAVAIVGVADPLAEPLGSVRWHAGKTASARRYRARSRARSRIRASLLPPAQSFFAILSVSFLMTCG
jgi:hypothetical protein